MADVGSRSFHVVKFSGGAIGLFTGLSLISVVVNRKGLSVQFLQILSAESLSVSAERKFALSAFLQIEHFLQKERLSAERGSFCRNMLHFWQKEPLISEEFSSNFYRKKLFLQKVALSAETASFGTFGISAERDFFQMVSFGFLQKERNPLSVDH